ncbi:Serine/threonine-protein phosphatase 6 regulatory ankyrin repeat like [Verticillium longisporum]|nr:Serine/threonine-protein phosphatase 6 regulatory ankyrin repeat like [Verticillium longisporum]
MAEVVGLVLGLVALVPQLTAGVKMLRQIRNADDRFPVEIDRLACDLELLVTFVEALEATPGVNEPVLQRCCECCTQIAQGLDKVRGMVSLVTTGSKSKRVIRKITGLPGLRTAVEALQQNVTRAQMTMMMTSHLPLLAGMSRLSLAPMLPTPEPSPVVEDSLITMIKFFFTELNITKGLYSPRRHNSRSNLLKCLITLGFDPSESPAPAARFWPRPSLVKVGGKHAAADPFSLEHLAILCRLSPGEFLLTPLHLALSNTRHMTALISSGHDVNALDRLGMTPLMYAGIMGLVNAVLLLLDRGADASLRDTKHNNLFIDFAASRNNWDVIMAALSRLETRSDNDTDWTWARHATILRHVEYPYHTRRRLGFKDFLAKCDTPSFIFDHNGRRGNTLMHFVIIPDDVQTLLDQGFTRVNQANSDGHSPLMRSLRRHRELPTILPILNAGTDVHHQDNNGHTALWYALYMEEEELIDLMEQEMEEAKALNYDQLRKTWFTQVKERLDAARADEVLPKPGMVKEQPPTRYHFLNPIGKQVAAYKGWIDFEFDCRKKYLEDNPIGNSWYDRRISHLRHLVKVMGVKPEEVSEHWYGLPNKGAEELF